MNKEYVKKVPGYYEVVVLRIQEINNLKYNNMIRQENFFHVIHIFLILHHLTDCLKYSQLLKSPQLTIYICIYLQ